MDSSVDQRRVQDALLAAGAGDDVMVLCDDVVHRGHPDLPGPCHVRLDDFDVFSAHPGEVTESIPAGFNIVTSVVWGFFLTVVLPNLYARKLQGVNTDWRFVKGSENRE